MNAFDVVLLVLLGVLVVVGVFRGMVRILVGIGALVAAFALAARYHVGLAAAFTIDAPAAAGKLIAYGAIFVGTLVAGGALAWVLRKLLRVAMLGWVDRLAGAALGLVAALLIAALWVLPLVAYSDKGQEVLEHSTLAPYVTVVADLANRFMPDDLAASYRRGVETLRERWRAEIAERAALTRI